MLHGSGKVGNRGGMCGVRTQARSVPGFEPKPGEKETRVKARKLVWEIPGCKADKCGICGRMGAKGEHE
jgi:hypothetical protein